MYKILLVGPWYGLSDEKTEEMVKDSLSAIKLCGLRLEVDVPDHSTRSRFITELPQAQALDTILNHINKHLQSKDFMAKGDKAKVDAPITDTPHKAKGKKTYAVAQDRKEDQRDPKDIQTEEQQAKSIQTKKPGVDSQARWVKKRGNLHYGYKAHLGVDEDGLVKSLHTTTENEQDSKRLSPLLYKMASQCNSIHANKGYKSTANDELISGYNLRLFNKLSHAIFITLCMKKKKPHLCQSNKIRKEQGPKKRILIGGHLSEMQLND